jgi:hypothetical protein
MIHATKFIQNIILCIKLAFVSDLGCGRQTFMESTGTENKVCLPWTHETNMLTERQCLLAARRGRRRKQLLDDLNETKGYLKLKQEALDRALWRTRFGKCYVLVVIETME